MDQRDYYQVLGLSRSATAAELKRAYRKLAKRYHPDHNPGDSKAEARFKEVQAAYDCLSDSDKKKLYDQFGHAGAGAGGAQEAGWRSGPSGSRVYAWQSGGGSDIPIEDIDDLFSVFGGGEQQRRRSGRKSVFDGFFGGAGGQPPPRRPRSGGIKGDLEHPVSLTFDQAIRGTSLDLRLSLSSGNSARTVTVKIPPGVGDGQRIRVRGKGHPGGSGTPAGDLFITCRVTPHPYFRRVGKDIYLEVPLSITEAALGAKLEIPTLDGQTVLTIPAGASSGTKLRLKGKGVQPAGREPRGDQYVVLRIVPPKKLIPGQRELLEQLRDLGGEEPRRDVGW